METINKKFLYFEILNDESDEITLYDSRRNIINKLNSREGKWKQAKLSDKNYQIFAYGSWIQKNSNFKFFIKRSALKLIPFFIVIFINKKLLPCSELIPCCGLEEPCLSLEKMLIKKDDSLKN